MTADNRPKADKRRKYVEIADYLLELIKTEQVQPASRLPVEKALAEQFGAARETVRQAYAHLIRSGHVESRPGAGYFVRVLNNRKWSLTDHGRFSEPWGVQLAQRDHGEATTGLTIRVDQPDKLVVGRRVGDLIGLADDERALCRSTIHYLDGEPVAVTATYLPHTLIRHAALLDHDLPAGGIVFALHKEGYQLTGYTDTLIARNPTEAETESLELPDATPVMEILRRLRFQPEDLHLAVHSIYNGAGAEFVHHMDT